MMNVSDVTLFFGRFHPVLVHLPIGFALLLALLELRAYVRRSPSATPEAGFMLALIVPVSGFTALCGWLLSLGGGYEERLLQIHLWTGVGTVVASAITFALWWFKRLPLYRLSLFGTAVLLMAAGHYGGSLTHGRDYLFRYAPEPVRSWFVGHATAPSPLASGDLKTTSQFSKTVQPVLQKYCVSCHGPEKAKGGLRLDSYAFLMAGSEKGAVVKPGGSGSSKLIRLITLPPANEDRMPPEGKPQPTSAELALIQVWIDSGATQ